MRLTGEEKRADVAYGRRDGGHLRSGIDAGALGEGDQTIAPRVVRVDLEDLPEQARRDREDFELRQGQGRDGLSKQVQVSPSCWRGC